MTSNPDSMFSFRDRALAGYYDRAFGRSHRHQAIKVDIERYRCLLEQSMPVLSKLEAVEIFSFLEGLNPSEGEMSLLFQEKIAEEMDESSMFDLAQKVRSFSHAEWLAVLDACVRAMKGNYRVVDVALSLKEVGLYA